MGRVLNHGDIARIADRHDRIHVRGMATHMADDDGRDVIVDLGFEVLKIDPVVFANLAKNGVAVGMNHS